MNPQALIREHYLRGGWLTVGVAHHLYGTHDLRRVNSRLNKEFRPEKEIRGRFEEGKPFKTYRLWPIEGN
jgi:hypothetical protein